MKVLIYLLMLISLSQICHSTHQKWSLFERNPDNNGKQCMDVEKLFTTNTSSTVECAMVCRPIVDCKQIFYDASSQTCMGCSSFQSQIYYSSTSQNYVSANNGEELTNMGCYSDLVDSRTLNSGQWFLNNALTVEMCVEFCITNKGYTYAGTENGNECYCGNVLPVDRLVPDSECTRGCKGNTAQLCGNGWRLSVYTEH
ncbi:hypothetical protein ACF0H5_007860 [Mactra antiquata]